MNIGVIVQNSRMIQKDGQDVEQKWLEMILRPPMMQSATFSIHPNKNKKNQNEPDLNIWYNFSRKGENFRGTKVGAIWKKLSKDKQTEYFSGHVENPLVYGGKMYLTIYKAKVLDGEKAEDINWTHDVVWEPPKSNKGQNNGYTANTYVPPVEYSQNGSMAQGSMTPEQMQQEASMYM